MSDKSSKKKYGRRFVTSDYSDCAYDGVLGSNPPHLFTRCEIRSLPDELQRELNLPRSSRRASNLSSPRSGSSCTVENHGVGYWRVKISVIQAIKHLHSKLHIELFRDSFDRIIFI